MCLPLRIVGFVIVRLLSVIPWISFQNFPLCSLSGVSPDQRNFQNPVCFLEMFSWSISLTWVFNFQRRIMGIGRIEISGVILLSLLVSSSQGISCTAILQSLDCLPAFSHAPASLTKCYCSSLCPDIESLRQNCPSGQLQTDPCGVCLQCAPGVRSRCVTVKILSLFQFGERCGGYANEAGECSGGLGCLIK